MTSSEIVSDPQLTAVLAAAAQARQQCEKILALIAESKDDDGELDTERKKLYSDLAIVRGLNRKAILDVRRTKQETADARHEVDTLHLQLQNLYYEQRHLNGEIASCENYDHSYKKLPLLPTEVYLSQHPEHASLDEHELMLKRIEHEHAERLQLEEKRQALLKRKQALISENNRRKELLASLDKKIEEWIEGSEGVETEFAKVTEEMTRIGGTASASDEENVTISQ
ncbi:uncharacterized protein PV09_06922 [Verruconis gallopava]|uniref:THO complex subunit 5 n=1 Tax=Verruconis gallopava TaxID=253628 RepID=A0A0D1XHM9_9PEZI|nr:uncharacterized protein PV09_06922 [Verruconis gallopava]KIW01746.1 hypothetical protein PV09_06922 [Verruconis gallopava]